jgi:chromosome segregation ATPase
MSAKQEITDKDNLINQLQTENSQQKATITRKNTFISRQQQKITDSRKDKRDLQIEIQALKADKKSLQDENASKDQKIAQLEQIIQELRDKPPVSPVNNLDKTDNSPKQEPNNFLKEELLKKIQQNKETITELQNQLKNQSPQIIVKEVPVENLTAIQQLKKELKSKERNIKQLHLIYLLSLGVSVLVLASLTLIKKARKTKKN